MRAQGRTLGTDRRWLGSVLHPTPAQSDAPARCLAFTSPRSVPLEPPLDRRLFDDDEVCEAWRGPRPALQNSSARHWLPPAVEVRDRYLEELLGDQGDRPVTGPRQHVEHRGEP